MPDKPLIFLDHIMYQPTWCGLKCPDCYVKQAQSTQTMDADEAEALVHRLVTNGGLSPIRPSQFTLSLDSFPNPCIEEEPAHGALVALQEALVGVTTCITVHDTATLQRYLSPFLTKGFSINSIAISTPPTAKDSHQIVAIYDLLNGRTQPHPKIIWNLLPETVLGMSQSDLETLTFLVPSAGVHLLLRKNPTGLPLSDSALQRWAKARDMLTDRGVKVLEDHCIGHRATQIPCPKGKTEFHIWPDGTITGCPYDSYKAIWKRQSYGLPRTASQIISQLEGLAGQQPELLPWGYCRLNKDAPKSPFSPCTPEAPDVPLNLLLTRAARLDLRPPVG